MPWHPLCPGPPSPAGVDGTGDRRLEEREGQADACHGGPQGGDTGSLKEFGAGDRRDDRRNAPAEAVDRHVAAGMVLGASSATMA